MTPKYRPSLEVTNGTIDSILAHKVVRAFSDKPVTPAELEAILAAALSAPTSSNQNCWSVVAVRDPKVKAEVTAATGRNEFLNDAPVLLVWLADLSRAHKLCEDAGVQAEVMDYQEGLLIATIDVALASQNALVAAESLGMGTCYIGGIRTDIERVAELLDLPQYCYPVLGMAIGWPSEEGQGTVKPRIELSARAFEDRYDGSGTEEAMDKMERENNEMLESLGLQPMSWKQFCVKHWSDVDSMAGRAHNREIIAGRGFLDR